jgi:hypothetical protein
MRDPGQPMSGTAALVAPIARRLARQNIAPLVAGHRVAPAKAQAVSVDMEIDPLWLHRHDAVTTRWIGHPRATRSRGDRLLGQRWLGAVLSGS